MKKYFSFHGRAKRSEYWGVAIVLFVVNILFQFVLLPTISLQGPGVVIPIVLGWVMIWLTLAVTARRLRDAGINHWYMLLLLVPIVNPIAPIIWGCIKSKR